MSKKAQAFQASCYRVRIQRKEFDPTTGKEKFPPFEQYFTPDEFKRFKDNPNGYTLIEVLYDPTETVKAETAEEKPSRSRKS